MTMLMLSIKTYPEFVFWGILKAFEIRRIWKQAAERSRTAMYTGDGDLALQALADLKRHNMAANALLVGYFIQVSIIAGAGFVLARMLF